MAIRSALRLDGEMVPCLIVGIAGNARGMPLLPLVVPDIPLMPPGNSALMPPDIRLTIHELVDVKLQRLRGGNVVTVEVHVVNEVVRGRSNFVIAVPLALRREVADQVVIPQSVGELRLAADAELRGISTP